MRCSENFVVSASMCSRISWRYSIGERLGHDRDLLAALEILEARRVRVAEVDLRRIEHVEHDQVVAEELERLDRVEDDVRVFVEIRDEQRRCCGA